MIHLTRLNGNSLVVNSDLIKYVEASPDTVLTLVNGEKIVVLESSDEVVARTVAWRGRLLAAASSFVTATAWPPPAEAACSPATNSAPPCSAEAPED
ncbi:MAG: flagellar FlbD family protein [Acidobacteriaceae bacterium]